MFKGKTRHGVGTESTLGIPTKRSVPMWILVLHQSLAQIFEKASLKSKPRLLHEIKNPKGRMKIHEIMSDKPGRSFDSFTKSRHGQTSGPRHPMTKEVNPKEQAAFHLVSEVARALKMGQIQNAYDRLVLISNPRLLGRIRNALNPGVKKCVVAEHELDLAWVSSNELLKRINSLEIGPLLKTA